MTQKILAKLMSFAGSNKLGLFKIAIASSFLVIVPQGQVKAALLTVANNSFEAPIITAPQGFTNDNTITGWVVTPTGSAQTGLLNPFQAQNFAFTNGTTLNNTFYNPGVGAPNGNQIAYSNGGTISQTLTGTTLQADTKYTLSASVGRRRIVSTFSGLYNIQLYAGANLLASKNDIIPNLGDFADVSFSYTTAGIGTLPSGDLRIVLTSNGSQVGFDNITLDATPDIPEPSAILGLLGFGLLGIASKLRQKQ
ncbi:MAG: PEP-CTERM sorting domain-containing protein [Microcystis sp. M20BS1]|uniref:PEP-CTERM sorting domain-containing protein n=1 Tax=Microcystis viridis FACHB-1342 TaxID=2692900 RepID=A0ABR8GE04_MICVR|nr:MULTISPECIES: PEP-CTERM sorting domain-containing protein [Microcystis]MBD2601577.1 PEP-CTERM sorting domain-containing protein [Microcystis viridis FACHB-1342]MCA2625872.1 PEP-CTERM sorting domain-containing protein [Microcystis sp. M19BS1]MCA2634106.1 PEP-CTERM sorting domain-containing protein [Microcystis sp. M20BS1]